jgi:uncharacterized membrane protein (UPF0127 family)
MSYPFDAVFCDADGKVLHVVRGMRPRRVTRIVWRARSVYELTQGAAEAISPGDKLLRQVVAGPSSKVR